MNELSAAVEQSLEVLSLSRAEQAQVKREIAKLGNLKTHRVFNGETTLFPGRAAGTESVIPELPKLDPSLTAKSKLAAGLIASALDRHWASRGRWGTIVPATATAVEGCDVVDQLPLLCVGSEADNTYTRSTALLIDLGGNDIYRMSAGGAPFPGPAGTLIPVSVNLDLGGDDQYIAEPSLAFRSGLSSGYLMAAQGSSQTGVGLLVDVAGNDTYRAQALQGSGDHSSLVAQGSSVGGLGALIDQQGDDQYSAAASAGADDWVTVMAQGAGSVGWGGLFDQGAGADQYGLTGNVTKTKPVVRDIPGRILAGQGAGVSGTGILYDEDGAGSFSAAAAVAGGGTGDDYQPQAYVWAQGSALQGAGFLLAGSGDSIYTLSTQGTGLAFVHAWGQGFASTGTAVLEDEGGADRYTGAATLTYEQEKIIDDACKCPFAQFLADHRVRGGALLEAQGVGEWGGTGVLVDHEGNDTYQAATTANLSVLLRDRLTAPTRPPVLEVHSTNSQPQLIAQGAGGVAGSGLLLDRRGTDNYSARYERNTSGEAVSDHATGEPKVTAMGWWRVGVAAQGAGYYSGSHGALIHNGLLRDSFQASAESRTVTRPNPDGGHTLGANWPAFQGAGFYLGSSDFVALGAYPSVISSPSQVTCKDPRGYSVARGYGQWFECAIIPGQERIDVYGQGAGRSSALGIPSRLEFTAATPKEAVAGPSQRVPVEVRLTDYLGNPIPGVPIHFDLQLSSTHPIRYLSDISTILNDGWASAWNERGVTDADGVARAALPLLYVDVDQYKDFKWRLFATFDGVPTGSGNAGIHPTHAASELVVK